MKYIHFKIPIYNWEVKVVTVQDEHDEEPLKQLLEQFELEEKYFTEELECVRKNCEDGGTTLTNQGLRKSVIIIYRWTEDNRFWEVINHEKRHLVDKILNWGNINDYEAAAFLDGYISENIFTNLKELRQ